MNSSLTEEQIRAIDSFDFLFREVSAFFDSNQSSPATLCKYVDGALKQFELEATTVGLHKKPSCVIKSHGKYKESWFKEILCKPKIAVAVAVFLLTSSLVIATLPVFYESSNDTLVSNFLNDPYVQAVLPKEYGYQLGVFYMNLKFKLARIMRVFAAYMGTLDVIGSLGSRGNYLESEDQCFFINPLFQEHAPPCSLCSGTEDIIFHPKKAESNKETWFYDMFSDGNIHLFEYSGMATSLHVLKQHIFSYLKAIDLEQHRFISNIDFVTSVKDLGDKHVISRLLNDMPSRGHIVWSTQHYTVSRLMRQVFQKPSIIPSSISTTHSKAILLDGPNALEYSLPLDKKMFALYIQGYGSRKLRLIPPADCVVKCSTHTVVTQTADVLIFDAAVWKAYSLPYEKHSSFAYVTYLIFPLDEEGGQ